MKKLKINGPKLKQKIKDLSLTIKAAAVSKGKIGEKTLYRLLGGEEINENIVLRLFQNLELNYRDYLHDETLSNDITKDSDEITLTANANSKIIMKKFELPDSSYLPLQTIWVFDFTNPTEPILKTLEELNNVVSGYCSNDKQRINSLNFESSYLRLTSTNIIQGLITSLASLEIYTYTGLYKTWHSHVERYDHDGDLWENQFINSKYQLALYFTRDNSKKEFVANVFIGNPPPTKKDERYGNVIVNGNENYYDDDIPF